MGGSNETFAYPPIADHFLWIADGKPRRDMTPEDLAERHRKDRETYRRMRERMASDPVYREARLAVSRETTRRYRERHPQTEAQQELRRARDNARYAALSKELGEKRRRAYVGDKADRIRANNSRWFAKHREERSARQRARRRSDGDAVRARERAARRRSYERDPRAYLKRQKEWRAKNLDKARLYVRISGQKRRAASAGTGFTLQQWLAVVEFYGGRCAYCGETGPVEIEHKIPLSRGGTNDISNIVPACRRCNRRKLAKTDVEFRALLEREAKIKAESSETEPGPDGSAPAG